MLCVELDAPSWIKLLPDAVADCRSTIVDTIFLLAPVLPPLNACHKETGTLNAAEDVCDEYSLGDGGGSCVPGVREFSSEVESVGQTGDD